MYTELYSTSFGVVVAVSPHLTGGGLGTMIA